MRNREQRLLNAVQRPDIYEEVLIESRGVPIALSIWKGNPGDPCAVFLPGTMTQSLFYEELLDGFSRAGFNVIGVHFQGHGKSPRVEQLFSFKAPSKELLVFDLKYHLLFNECLDAVLPCLVETLKRYTDTYVRVTETRGVR